MIILQIYPQLRAHTHIRLNRSRIINRVFFCVFSLNDVEKRRFATQFAPWKTPTHHQREELRRTDRETPFPCSNRQSSHVRRECATDIWRLLWLLMAYDGDGHLYGCAVESMDMWPFRKETRTHVQPTHTKYTTKPHRFGGARHIFLMCFSQSARWFTSRKHLSEAARK